MPGSAKKHDILTYPASRRATFDVGRIGGRKHHIAGFLELDVTSAREKIRSEIKSGRAVSFNTWLIKVIGDTVAANSSIHALNHRRNSQVAFHDVDISFPLEREVAGRKVPLAALVRGVNTKSLEEIHAEIRESLEKSIASAKDFVLARRKGGGAMVLFFRLPGFLRRLVWKLLLRNPFSVKRNMGTVMVTNIGMAGHFPGWILPKSLHNLCFGIGSIVKKPWVVDGKVEVRDILHMTILFDHDAVDGVPAARFTDALVKRIEGGTGL
ncbi:MAG: 2-oxo acid dehydrogenase subunit E2 [Spirochaetales bacterium]|nr:2-oxo acid dehydrogenase subunit E2 [Spirochaetales bacterium]